MSGSEHVDPSTIPLDLLRRYMRARGWRNATRAETAPPELPPERLTAFRTFLEARARGNVDYELMVNPQHGQADIKVAFPTDANGPDYLSRVERVVDLLSKLEQRSPAAIARSIRAIGFDAIYSRLPDAAVRADTVSFLTAAEHVATLKTALVNTAMTEVRPVSHFDHPLKAATDYAETCRFGHTFRGSFGFTVESPVAPNTFPALLPDVQPALPFERRVVMRFARGLRAVQRASAADDLSILLDGPEQGFGANAYEAAADLIDASIVGLILDFSFSPEWVPPADIPEQTRVELMPIHAELAREAGRALRNRLTPEPVEILGTVVGLRSEQIPQLLEPKGSRVLTIKWTSSRHGEIRTTVRVSAEDYLLALQAHEKGQPIRVRGTLEYRRGWTLVDPSALLWQ